MSITVEHLEFAYRTRPVLQDVSFCAEKGRLLAVLGPNGAGKTTLFRCVLGLLRGYQGRILVDGTEARTLSARELAHRIAYIPQIHGEAFAYSALEMVLMGTTHSISPFSAPKEKETAAALAALERLGIAHLAEQSFSRLSGGEQQRIAIARVMLKNAPVVILDEATAFADPDNESRVQAAFSKLSQGKTVIMIAHRLSTVAGVDQIYVIEDGQITESGKSRELLEKGGVFSHMWQDYQTSVQWKVAKEVQ